MIQALTQGSQTKARDAHRGLRLPILSPYFQTKDYEKDRQIGRDTRFILSFMAVNRAVIRDLEDGGYPNWFVVPYFLDGTTGAVVSSYGIQFSIAGVTTGDDVINAAEVAVNSYAAGQGYTLSAGIIWEYPSVANVNALIAAALASFTPALPAKTFSNPTRALNTAYQPSATRDTLVTMSVEIDAALSLSGGAKGTVALVVSPTSAFTTSVTDGEGVNGNTGTLTVGLNTVGAGGGTIVGVVPAGYYYKAVTANTTGTPTFTVLSTQEVQL